MVVVVSSCRTCRQEQQMVVVVSSGRIDKLQAYFRCTGPTGAIITYVDRCCCYTIAGANRLRDSRRCYACNPIIGTVAAVGGNPFFLLKQTHQRVDTKQCCNKTVANFELCCWAR